jgi:hypothetical protein
MLSSIIVLFKKIRSIIVLATLSVVVLFLYQNCGFMPEGFSTISTMSEDLSSTGGDPVGPLSTDQCEEVLIQEFAKKDGYYDFLKNNCSACHNGSNVEAPAFAHTNIAIAWPAFMNKEILSSGGVSARAVSNHQEGITGPQNQVVIEELHSALAEKEKTYNVCKGISLEARPIKTAEISLDFISDQATLNADSVNPEKKFTLINNQLEFSAEISRLKQASYAVIKKPTFILLGGAKPTSAFSVKKLSIYINGILNTEMTVYNILDGMICSANKTVLMSNKNSEIFVKSQFLATDKISFEIGDVEEVDKSAVQCSPDITAVVNGPTIPSTVKFSELTGTNTNLNVFTQKCSSCHGSGAAGNLNILNFDAAKAKSDKIMLRINNGTMPPNGGMDSYQKALIQKWIDTGFPQ